MGNEITALILFGLVIALLIVALLLKKSFLPNPPGKPVFLGYDLSGLEIMDLLKDNAFLALSESDSEVHFVVTDKVGNALHTKQMSYDKRTGLCTYAPHDYANLFEENIPVPYEKAPYDTIVISMLIDECKDLDQDFIIRIVENIVVSRYIDCTLSELYAIAKRCLSFYNGDVMQDDADYQCTEYLEKTKKEMLSEVVVTDIENQARSLFDTNKIRSLTAS